MRKIFIFIVLLFISLATVKINVKALDPCVIDPTFCIEDGGGGGTPTPKGTLTIYSDPTYAAGSSSGEALTKLYGSHAFVSIQNTGSVPFEIGSYTIQPNEEITISKWGNRTAHDGIWYNLELHAIFNEGRYANRVSITTSLTASEISAIDNFVDNDDDYAINTDNCVSFSTSLWALAAQYTLPHHYLGVDSPKKLADTIDNSIYHKVQEFIPYNSNIGYTVNGTFVLATDLSKD